MALMSFREANQMLWRGVRPAHNGTQVIAQKAADNLTATIYTVGVGETLYLCSATMGFVAIAAGQAIVQLINAAPVWTVYAFYDVILAGSEGRTQTRSYWPPVEMSAGSTITVQSVGAGLNLRASIHGWVE